MAQLSPDIAAMSPAEKRALIAHLEGQRGADSILDYVERCGAVVTEGVGTVRPYHLRALAEVFDRVEKEGRVRCLSSVPPQHGKTTLILHALVRLLERKPHFNIAYVGYGYGFVQEKARDARQIRKNTGLKLDTDNLHSWRTKEGGGLKFLSKNGTMTGLKFDLVVIDDPHRDWDDAANPLEQAKILSWFTTVAMTRLTARGSAIVNGTRWHPDDLIGQLSRGDGQWDVINIPAIVDEGLPTERALWPEVKPLEFIKSQRREQGDFKFEALYMGRPISEGGFLFRDPQYFNVAELKPDTRYAIGVDVASTAGGGDYSVIAVLGANGYGADQVAYLLDYWTDRVDAMVLCERISAMRKKWPGARVLVETNGVGKAIPDILKRVDPELNITPINIQSSKYSRAFDTAAAWNDGRLLLRNPALSEADYVPALVARVKSFTGKRGQRDDDVDAIVTAYSSGVYRFAPGDQHGVYTTRGKRVSSSNRVPESLNYLSRELDWAP